ncbi:hypothetical protein N7510_001129 [Penicillium lagena]|uniref:uncharacterized protein n=1 Tax=Penicillium lagena TaxID=94218 RepID=UPI00253FD9F6|nr:uncharacterized protein N7510_001129 [Penicillium lagena]KAJ5624820.1 hypothetical protein N7510_001129 [Penicillium lagena]
MKKSHTHRSTTQSRRFSFFSSQNQETITSSVWEDLKGSLDHLLPGRRQKSLPDPNQPVWWLDIHDATDQDIASVAQTLSIHPLTAENIATRDTGEKVEVFPNYYLISFQTLVSSRSSRSDDDGHRADIPPSTGLYILVFHYGVVTFSPGGCGHVHRVRHRMRKMHDPAILSSDWICYALIDDIIDSFEPFMRTIERESEAIEDQVFIVRIDDVKALIPQVDFLRKKITHIIRVLHGKVDVLNGFVKRCQAPDKGGSVDAVFPNGDLLLYLGDVQDHLVTMLSSLAHTDEIISRSRANCLAQLNATNVRVSLAINSTMSKVTLLAAIFVPLHLVTGLFGMNVEVPGQLSSGLSWFFGIVGVFGAFVIVCIAIAAKMRFL